ncbi:MAG: prephenate dehydratase [Verrucomicrobiia bacterium]
MNLDELRNAIDQTDAQILALLGERFALARKVGDYKTAHQLEVYSPEREETMLRRLVEQGLSIHLPASAVRAIFREIISASISLEKPLSIAFLGPEATWSHQAARAKFGSQVSYLPQQSIPEVFAAVERRKADFGIVPIENSTEGSVGQTLDQFMESDLRICGELSLRINHNLAGHGKLADLKRVYSHSQSFGQCRKWLTLHLPHADLIPVASNAKAAATAAAEPEAAAICGALAAELHHLPIIERSIQDHAENTTRFVVIGRLTTQQTGIDRTSLMLIIQDRAGALYDALEPMRHAGISLTRIESRPSRRKAWEYCFFIDLLGHVEDPQVAKVLSELASRASVVKVLGSYPITTGGDNDDPSLR